MRKIAISANPLNWGFCGTRTYLEGLFCGFEALAPAEEFVLLADRQVPRCTPKLKSTIQVVWPSIKDLKTKIIWEKVTFPYQARSIGADLIHIPYHAASVCKIPYLMTVFDTNPWDRETARLDPRLGLYRWLTGRAACRATGIITASEYAKSRIVQVLGVDEAKVHVCPLAPARHPAGTVGDPDPAEFRREYALDRPYILNVGGTGENKGLFELVSAYSLLPKDVRTSFDLVFLGTLQDGNMRHRQIADVIARVQGGGRVVQISHLSSDHLLAAYRGASMFVFPSFAEGFGLPPLEAMARGVPVASSNRTSLPEVLGDAAVYFDPSDPEAIKAAIMKLATDSAEASRLRERGPAQAARFTWQATAARTLEIYRSN